MRTLFDKLAAPSAQALGGRARPGMGLEAIVSNLENILNTKQGYGSPLSDFGIRSITEYTSREQIAQAVMADVREAIERYEPRLELLDIALDEQQTAFRLSFDLHCVLREGSKDLRVSFDTRISRFRVAQP